MSKPESSIFPIEHGKLTTDLDANNLQIVNLDASNLSIGGNGAPHTVTFIGSYSGDVITADQAVFLDGDIGATISDGGVLLPEGTFIVAVTSATVVQISYPIVGTGTGVTFAFDRLATAGNDTGTTTAILKGDGDHGFADAIEDQDYASVGSVQLRELSADHDTDITAINDELSILNTALVGISGDVSGKADLTYVDAGLAAKEDITDHDTDITAVTGAIATVASNLASLTTTVGTKADSSTVTSALATKEPLLPTTTNDSFVLARHSVIGGSQWFFVDPVTLGSTNATYNDGATHSSTTFDSTLAVFTPDDVGKTILCVGNIPTDTTISAFVNSTTVTLSNAATTTASGLSFTILNRFLPTGSSGGTVTSVALNNNATAILSIPAITNASTTPTITINPTTPVAHTFYGNPTGSAAAAVFMDAAQSRNNLGGTLVGQAIFQVSGVSAISYPRMSADNITCAMFTRPQVVADLGVEPALTFNAPLARGLAPNAQVISIPAAASSPAQVSGYLTGADHALFTAKIGTSSKIITTAPLRIGGVSGGAGLDLSVTRTIDMPAAAGDSVGPPTVALQDGYLTGADHSLFVNKPPNSRTLAATAPLTISPGTAIAGGTQGDLSANRTLAMPKATSLVDGYLAAADFGTFLSGSPHTDQVGNVTSWVVTAPTTRVVFTQPLTGPLAISLPHPNTYPNASTQGFIEFVDVASPPAMTTVGITLVPLTGTSVDGLLTPFTLPRGTQYLRINSNGGTRWTSTKYYTTSFQDPVTPTKIVNVDVSGQTAGTTRTWSPATAGNSGSCVAKDQSPGAFFNSYDSVSGLFGTSAIHVYDLISTQDSITTASITANAHSVPNSGQVDSVRLTPSPALSAPLTVTWPQASKYSDGEVVRFYDAVGTLNATTYATIAAFAGDTINGAATAKIAEQFASRTFIADPATNSWAMSQFSGANEGITVAYSDKLVENTSQHTLTWPIVTGVNFQTAYAIPAATATLQFTGSLVPGMKFELIFIQPATLGPVTLNLPSGSRTPANGLGVLDISTTANAVDKVSGTYYGASGLNWMWDTQKNYTAAAPIGCNTNDLTNGNGISAGLTLASGSGTTYYAAPFTPASTTMCRVDVGLYYAGTLIVGQQCAVELRLNNAGVPGAVVSTTGFVPVESFASGVAAGKGNTLAEAVSFPTRFNFPATIVGINTANTYWITVHVTGGTNGANHPNWAFQNVASSPHPFKSPDGAVWTDSTFASTKLYFKTYNPT